MRVLLSGRRDYWQQGFLLLVAEGRCRLVLHSFCYHAVAALIAWLKGAGLPAEVRHAAPAVARHHASGCRQQRRHHRWPRIEGRIDTTASRHQVGLNEKS